MQGVPGLAVDLVPVAAAEEVASRVLPLAQAVTAERLLAAAAEAAAAPAPEALAA